MFFQFVDKDALMNRRLEFLKENHPLLAQTAPASLTDTQRTPPQASPNWFLQLQLNLQQHKTGSSLPIKMPHKFNSKNPPTTHDRFQPNPELQGSCIPRNTNPDTDIRNPSSYIEGGGVEGAQQIEQNHWDR